MRDAEYLAEALGSINENTVLSISEIWRVWRICWEAECGYELYFRFRSPPSGKRPPRVIEIRRTSDNHFHYYRSASNTGELEASDELSVLDDPWHAIPQLWREERLARPQQNEIIEAVLRQDSVWEFRYEKLRPIVDKTKATLLGQFEDHRLSNVVSYDNPEDMDLYKLLQYRMPVPQPRSVES